MDKKNCNRCKIEKPNDEYTRDSSKKDGLRNICRACEHTRRKGKDYREKENLRRGNPEVKERRYKQAKEYRDRPNVKQKTKERRQSPENRRRERENARQWKLVQLKNDPRAHKIKIMLQSARRRARVKGIAFSIKPNDIPHWKEITHCPVFPWIELCWTNTREDKMNSPSLDRTDNNLGYISGNVRIVSWRANVAKWDLTPNELEALCADMRRVNDARN